MARIPDKETYQRAWSGLSFGQRREILRAVARGQAMRRRKDARMAVVTARQQQRYWRWAWLVAPAISLLSIPDWAVVAIQAIILSAVMGGFAWHRVRRATAAEVANLARLEGSSPPPPRSQPSADNPFTRLWDQVRARLP